jgi:Predicted 3'-5' exonuclease related to the exonuclease domain of PolB
MIIFDLETTALPLDVLESQLPPLAPWPHGDFDPANVKHGRITDPAKRQAKEDAEREKFNNERCQWGAGQQACRDKFIERAALSPTTGQILAIGWGHVDESMFCMRSQDDETSEHALLNNFWFCCQHYLNKGESLVGFNIFEFDLPFALRRSWLLGVDVPTCLHVRRGKYLNWSPIFVDLLDIWRCGSKEYISLDALCKLFGINGKPDGVTGADFARLFETEPDKARAYLENDVMGMTLPLAKKLQVL